MVIFPPTGYTYLCAHRTLRVLAERLAGQGHAVLRVDYDGTGDSAGDQWDPDRVPAWRATLQAAVAELRALGCRQVTLVGVRLGATFVLLDGAALAAQRIVAWAPVVSGRRFAKELRLLSTPVPAEHDPLHAPGTIVAVGYVFSAETIAAIQALGLAELSDPSAAPTLVLDDPRGSAAGAVEHLRTLGADVHHQTLPGGETALETPPEFATVPEPILDTICDFIGRCDRGGRKRSQPRARADLRWQHGRVVEEVITLPPNGQIGVLCSPVAPNPARATLVLLNPGSETHVGPGRAWVEYARSLALLGHRSARVDFRGWGESPDDGRAPGRPYDACGEEDAVSIVQSLREAGHERVVLCGLCAGAWIALRAVLHGTAAGVIALNPQMYWQPGDLVEINWDLIRAGRAREIRQIERGAKLHLWNVLDAFGERPPAGAWLDKLAATGLPVKLLFAAGDDGLVFLRSRLARRLERAARAGTISVRELGDIDHPMHRTWSRPLVVQALHEALDEIDRRG